MQSSVWLTPYVLMTLASIATAAAVWFVVRRPAPARLVGGITWQTAQAGIAAFAAILAAVCVLGAIALS